MPRFSHDLIVYLVGKQERFDSMELYVSALYSSVPICAADLTMVPMYILDYHIRRIYLEKKRTSANPQIYQALFVGKGKNKPFKGTSGDQIRYVYLLKLGMYICSNVGKLLLEMRVVTLKMKIKVMQAKSNWKILKIFCTVLKIAY